MQWSIRFGLVPLQAWLFWLGHVLLVSFLIVASLTDLDHMEIPLSITLTGTLFGLVLVTCLPWPWPNDPADLALVRRGRLVPPVPLLGLQPWPLWRSNALPAWLAPGSWQLGWRPAWRGCWPGCFCCGRCASCSAWAAALRGWASAMPT